MITIKQSDLVPVKDQVRNQVSNQVRTQVRDQVSIFPPKEKMNHQKK